MTLLAQAQVIATSGAPWWAVAVSGIASALLTAPATLAIIKAREKRFGAEHGFAAEAFGRSEAKRDEMAKDLAREQHENAVLLAENVEYRRDVIEMREEIAELKSEIGELKTEMDGTKTDLRECHEGRAKEAEMRAEESEAHAANMQSLVLWMTDEMVRAGMRPSSPPKLRSITPRDFPAVTSTDGAKKNV